MIPRKKDVYLRYDIPNVVTVQIDTREQIPLLFPAMIQIVHPELQFKNVPIAVQQERIALPFGDYRLKEYPNVAVIERKAAQLELFKNMNESHDRIRQAKSFRKLTGGCQYPYLMCEVSPGELLSENQLVKQPELTVHRLSLAMAKYDLRLLFIPWRARNAATRRKVGTFLIHLMLGHVLQKKFDVPATLLEEE